MLLKLFAFFNPSADMLGPIHLVLVIHSVAMVTINRYTTLRMPVNSHVSKVFLRGEPSLDSKRGFR